MQITLNSHSAKIKRKMCPPWSNWAINILFPKDSGSRKLYYRQSKCFVIAVFGFLISSFHQAVNEIVTETTYSETGCCIVFCFGFLVLPLVFWFVGVGDCGLDSGFRKFQPILQEKYYRLALSIVLILSVQVALGGSLQSPYRRSLFQLARPHLQQEPQPPQIELLVRSNAQNTSGTVWI